MKLLLFAALISSAAAASLSMAQLDMMESRVVQITQRKPRFAQRRPSHGENDSESES